MTNSFPHRSPSDLVVALLRGHSPLAGALTAEVTDGDAFREGLAEGARRDLAASLFGIRAASVLGLRDDADAASFASGVLICADVAARMDDCPFEHVHLLAHPGERKTVMSGKSVSVRLATGGRHSIK